MLLNTALAIDYFLKKTEKAIDFVKIIVYLHYRPIFPRVVLSFNKANYIHSFNVFQFPT
ncbi:MAG: hypothetical protein U0U67_07540 [Chitinophagales bacterium]